MIKQNEKPSMKTIMMFLFLVLEHILFDSLLLKILEQKNTQSRD